MDKRFFIDKTSYKLFNKFDIFTKTEVFEEVCGESNASCSLGFLVEKEYFEREFNIKNKEDDEKK